MALTHPQDNTETRPANKRLHDVDALRGLALLGIVVVNIWFFADPWYLTGAENPNWQSPLDAAVRALVTLVFETKFYLLFAFLFGYSFTLQIDAAARAGAGFSARIVRRQLGLAAIGIAHGLLLFSGDVLTTYALLGAILLALRNSSDRVALWLVRGLIGLSGAFWIITGLATLAGGQPTAAETPDRLAAFSGSAGDTLSLLLAGQPDTFAMIAITQGPSALAAFLIGLVAGRRRLLADPGALLPKLRRFAARYGAIGVLGALVYTLGDRPAPDGAITIVSFGIDVLTAPLLTVVYVTLALAWFARAPRVRTALAATGRLALTNYLSQSLVLALIFTGYGLGLVDRVAPVFVVVIAFAIFALQVIISRWWVTRYRYGPAEWVLRKITNGVRSR